MSKVIFNEELCKGCGLCVNACPKQILALSKTRLNGKGHTPVEQIDPDKCIGCQLCYKACFVDVIRWDAEKKQPIFQYVEDCERCFFCEFMCKKDALKVVPDYASEHLMQSFDGCR